jgi:hypothetical protein
MYVNKLKVSKKANYKSATNAAGNTTVKYITTKRTIEVGIIPLDDASMKALLAEIDKFQVSISYRDPETGALENNVKCIIPDNAVEYYTIRADKVMYKAFTIKISEL